MTLDTFLFFAFCAQILHLGSLIATFEASPPPWERQGGPASLPFSLKPV